MNEQNMMHGCDWDGQEVAGWIVSEKLDGCRAYWDGATLWSRGGIAIQLPTRWREALPDGLALDCELYDGLDGLSRCTSAVRHGRFRDSMRLVAFDAPAVAGSYIKRMAVAAAALRGSVAARAIEFDTVGSNTEALDRLAQVLDAGGEGLMLRHPDLGYQPGRTGQLLKLKRLDQAEW